MSLAERQFKFNSMRMRGVRVFILSLTLFMVFAGIPSSQASTPLLEYQVKAAFLFNFAKFVEWPPQTFPDHQTPIIIGILGENPFEETLNGIVQGQKINERPIEIKQSQNIEELKNCQLLFISQSEQNSVREILQQLNDKSVLTISEAENFLENGGMILFVKKKDKICFKINQDSAKEAHLKISSRLLGLADRS